MGPLMGNLVGNRFVEGYLARMIYLAPYRSHQRIVLGTFRTLLMTAADRITRRIRPRLKLH